MSQRFACIAMTTPRAWSRRATANVRSIQARFAARRRPYSAIRSAVCCGASDATGVTRVSTNHGTRSLLLPMTWIVENTARARDHMTFSTYAEKPRVA